MFIVICGVAANVVNLPVANPSQIFSNVYYIDTSNSPSFVTIKLILNYSNYHAWPWSMWLALESKNKFDFVDGSL